MKHRPQLVSFTAFVNIVRFLVSATFIFSGFVKAIDPKGTAYKLDAYLSAFGFPDWADDGKTLVAAVMIASVEFLLGIYLLFGIRRKFTVALLLAIMALFTPFTLYLALTNPVSDCGCFGDALHLTNWQTFGKNILLLLSTLLLFFHAKKLFPLVTVSVHWAYSLFTMIYILVLCMASIHYLPLIDLRPYKVGTDLPKAMSVPEGAKPPVYEMQFVMEKNGKEQTFTLDNYPDSTWHFVRRIEILKEKGYVPPVSDFAIIDNQGNDITRNILADTSTTFVVVSPYLEKADPDVVDELNTIHDFCMDKGYNMIGLTASDSAAISRWRYNTGAVYPIYFTDALTLKTMIRSNPGLIQITAGKIDNKWSCNNLPLLYAGDKKSEAQIKPGSTADSSLKVLLKYALAYIVPLLFITLALNFGKALKRRTKAQ